MIIFWIPSLLTLSLRKTPDQNSQDMVIANFPALDDCFVTARQKYDQVAKSFLFVPLFPFVSYTSIF
jgi:hypothetical protein